MKEVNFGSKKLWTTLFPPSFGHRQGFRSWSEPLTHEKPSSNCEAPPKEDAFKGEHRWYEDSVWIVSLVVNRSSFERGVRGKGLHCQEETRFCTNPLMMKTEKAIRASWVLIIVAHQSRFSSNPVIREKGLNFVGTYGMLVAENLEVSSFSPFQSSLSTFPPSCGLALPPLSAYIPLLPNSVIQS